MLEIRLVYLDIKNILGDFFFFFWYEMEERMPEAWFETGRRDGEVGFVCVCRLLGTLL